MTELSTEQKAKAYDKAIERARVWRDKNIKFETKLIYKILCAEQSQRCEFTSISIGKVQKKLSITNVGFKKNLQILEDNKYIRFNEYSRGLYTYEIC